MLTISRIARLALADRAGALLDEVLTNGRALPLGVRQHLGEAGNAKLAALGLGLQRAIELAYSPTTEILLIARRLIDAVMAATGPGGDGARCASGLAIAAGGLDDLLEAERVRGWALPADLRAAACGAVVAGAYPLFEAQARTAVLSVRERGLVGTRLDSAIVLWQVETRTGLLARLDPPVNVRDLRDAADRVGLWRDADCAAVLALGAVEPAAAGGGASRQAA